MIGPSLPQRLLLACLTLLLAVLALQWAADILARIWPTLAVAGGVVLTACGLVTLWRRRHGRW